MSNTNRPKAQIRLPSGAAAFVAQGSAQLVNQSTGESVDEPTTPPVRQAPAARSEATSRRGVVNRKRKGDLDRVTAYLPYELGAELRMRCAGQRIELSEAVAEAVRAWLVKAT
jgi:hypothetical protein